MSAVNVVLGTVKGGKKQKGQAIAWPSSTPWSCLPGDSSFHHAILPVLALVARFKQGKHVGPSFALAAVVKTMKVYDAGDALKN